VPKIRGGRPDEQGGTGEAAECPGAYLCAAQACPTRPWVAGRRPWSARGWDVLSWACCRPAVDPTLRRGFGTRSQISLLSVHPRGESHSQMEGL
jgi:hypothetical protein